MSVNLGGGFTIPYSDLKDAFGTGGNFQIGVNFRVSPMLKIQAEYGYNRLGSKDLAPTAATLPSAFISSIPLTANHTIHDGDFNLLIGPALGSKAAVPYGIVGVGVYHQIVNVTTPVGRRRHGLRSLALHLLSDGGPGRPDCRRTQRTPRSAATWAAASRRRVTDDDEVLRRDPLHPHQRTVVHRRRPASRARRTATTSRSPSVSGSILRTDTIAEPRRGRWRRRARLRCAAGGAAHS